MSFFKSWYGKGEVASPESVAAASKLALKEPQLKPTETVTTPKAKPDLITDINNDAQKNELSQKLEALQSKLESLEAATAEMDKVRDDLKFFPSHTLKILASESKLVNRIISMVQNFVLSSAAVILIAYTGMPYAEPSIVSISKFALFSIVFMRNIYKIMFHNSAAEKVEEEARLFSRGPLVGLSSSVTDRYSVFFAIVSLVMLGLTSYAGFNLLISPSIYQLIGHVGMIGLICASAITVLFNDILNFPIYKEQAKASRSIVEKLDSDEAFKIMHSKVLEYIQHGKKSNSLDAEAPPNSVNGTVVPATVAAASADAVAVKTVAPSYQAPRKSVNGTVVPATVAAASANAVKTVENVQTSAEPRKLMAVEIDANQLYLGSSSCSSRAVMMNNILPPSSNSALDVQSNNNVLVLFVCAALLCSLLVRRWVLKKGGKVVY